MVLTTWHLLYTRIENRQPSKSMTERINKNTRKNKQQLKSNEKHVREKRINCI